MSVSFVQVLCEEKMGQFLGVLRMLKKKENEKEGR